MIAYLFYFIFMIEMVLLFNFIHERKIIYGILVFILGCGMAIPYFIDPIHYEYLFILVWLQSAVIAIAGCTVAYKTIKDKCTRLK